jgi:hypothetical protein
LNISDQFDLFGLVTRSGRAEFRCTVVDDLQSHAAVEYLHFGPAHSTRRRGIGERIQRDFTRNRPVDRVDIHIRQLRRANRRWQVGQVQRFHDHD